MPAVPTWEIETDLAARLGSGRVVIGVDEVGKGSWAGPLAVGVVVADAVLTTAPADSQVMIRDSKTLSERRRESSHAWITEHCRWAVGYAGHDECDDLGMNAAQRLATGRALDALTRAHGVVVDAAVVDGRWDFVSPHVPLVETRVKADQVSITVAAASIVAKVSRDRLMRRLAESYPWWALDSNKGYPCAVHRAALRGYGPSAIHRRSWAFMDTQPWTGMTRRDGEIRTLDPLLPKQVR